MPAINRRLFALRFSHINNICCDPVLNNRRFLFGLANCKEFLKPLLYVLLLVIWMAAAEAEHKKFRDPFEPIASTAVEKNLSDYSVSTLKLVGIIKNEAAVNSKENSIVMSDPNNHLYFLKLGDVVGLESAKITQILDDMVVFQWLVKGQIFTDRLKLIAED